MTLVENLFQQRKDASKESSKKLKSIRLRRDKSAKSCAEICGVGENTYRHFESGIRQIGADKLPKIAEYLGIPTAALRDYNITDCVEIMHLLFDLSDSFGLIPTKLQQDIPYGLATKDETLTSAIKSWYLKMQEWEQKKISTDEYDDWKAAFPLHYEENPDISLEEDAREHRYTDRDRILLLRKSLQDMRLIVNDKCELIINNLNHKETKDARENVRVLQNTIDTLSKLDIEEFR